MRYLIVTTVDDGDGKRYVAPGTPGTVAEDGRSPGEMALAHPGAMTVSLAVREGASGTMIEWDDGGTRQRSRRWDGTGPDREVVGNGTLFYATAGQPAGATIAPTGD